MRQARLKTKKRTRSTKTQNRVEKRSKTPDDSGKKLLKNSFEDYSKDVENIDQNPIFEEEINVM